MAYSSSYLTTPTNRTHPHLIQLWPNLALALANSSSNGRLRTLSVLLLQRHHLTTALLPARLLLCRLSRNQRQLLVLGRLTYAPVGSLQHLSKKCTDRRCAIYSLSPCSIKFVQQSPSLLPTQTLTDPILSQILFIFRTTTPFL